MTELCPSCGSYRYNLVGPHYHRGVTQDGWYDMYSLEPFYKMLCFDCGYEEPMDPPCYARL